MFSLYSSCLFPIITGLIGVIAGLAMRKFQNFRDPRNIIKAIGFYFIASIFAILISSWMFGYLAYASVGTLIVQLILGSIFLVILMITFAKIVRPI
jgi:hypothetical protein